MLCVDVGTCHTSLNGLVCYASLHKHSICGCTIDILLRLCVWNLYMPVYHHASVASCRSCIIPIWMGTSAVSATSEAFCRWLHYWYTPAAVCVICTCRCIVMSVLHPARVVSCQSEWARPPCVPLQKHYVGGYTINMLPWLCVLEWTCLLCVLSVRVCSPLSHGRPTSAVYAVSQSCRLLHQDCTASCWYCIMLFQQQVVCVCHFRSIL